VPKLRQFHDPRLLWPKKKNRAIVDGFYHQLTTAARDPVYYERMNVPDTVMGRFEMLSIFMVLFFRRAEQAGPVVQQLSQDMVDRFFADIDHSIRELGIGDVGVPRRMKKLARMFYGRARSYGEALDGGDVALLRDALARNIHPTQRKGDTARSDNEADMSALAQTVSALDRAFAAQPEGALLSGRLDLALPQRRIADGAA